MLSTLYNYTIGTIMNGVNTATNGDVLEAINPGESVGTAPGDDLAQSQYDFRYMVFPNDLGMDTNGHYMVININVPTEGIKTNGLEVRSMAGSEELRRNAAAYGINQSQLKQVSKLDTLRYGTNSTGGAQTTNWNWVPRQTSRIAESIALHMPQSGLVYTHNNRYEDISLSGAILSGAKTVASGILGSNDGSVAGSRAAQARLNAMNNIIGVGDFGMKLGQNPINPAIEILFSNTLQRVFRFEFLFAPRNENESITVDRIIRTLKFHGSPEINDGVGWGLTWIPPAEFDITFYNKGYENTKLPRINTCVLQQIDVDYNPTGMYATFRNGFPVATRLMLEFVEIEPVHKQRVVQGF
jgi:hypothetical protein